MYCVCGAAPDQIEQYPSLEGMFFVYLRASGRFVAGPFLHASDAIAYARGLNEDDDEVEYFYLPDADLEALVPDEEVREAQEVGLGF